MTLKPNGFYVAASYFLTGEHRPYSRSNGGFGRIKPHKNVSPKDGLGVLLSGAWEAKARYTEVDLSELGGGKLETVTLGLNWYLIPNSKILVDYIIADREAVPGTWSSPTARSPIQCGILSSHMNGSTQR